MLKRPLILKLFALFMCIDPIIRLFLISIERDFSIGEVFTKTMSLTGFDFFNFWILFPVSALLLIAVRTQTYVLFLLLQFYSFYFHFNYESYAWPYLSKTPTATAYILLAINLFIVLYILMPRSREVFFDRSMRWWERGSRYSINEPCFVTFLDDNIHGQVLDLSFGGALLKLDQHIDAGSLVTLDFDILGKNLSLNAQVVRLIKNPDTGEIHFGLKFLFQDFLQKIELKMLMFNISLVGNYEKYR